MIDSPAGSAAISAREMSGGAIGDDTADRTPACGGDRHAVRVRVTDMHGCRPPAAAPSSPPARRWRAGFRGCSGMVSATRCMKRRMRSIAVRNWPSIDGVGHGGRKGERPERTAGAPRPRLHVRSCRARNRCRSRWFSRPGMVRPITPVQSGVEIEGALRRYGCAAPASAAGPAGQCRGVPGTPPALSAMKSCGPVSASIAACCAMALWRSQQLADQQLDRLHHRRRAAGEADAPGRSSHNPWRSRSP